LDITSDGNDENYTRWFEQPLDHFDPQNLKHWKQRYFVNDKYFDRETGPVFLCVGGEGPALTPSAVTENNVHCSLMVKLAKKKKALIVAAEHRFYGKSIPTDDFETESLKYLSSQQALADLSRLHEYISTEYKMGEKTRWVAWGGSYPGMLASFLRLKYPRLIWAAVASSAPVQAVANMVGFNDVVAESLSTEVVGGSLECRNAIRLAFEQLGTFLHNHRGRRMLEKKFNVCAPLSLDDRRNQEVFAEALTYVFPLQSNDPSCDGKYCNYGKICKLFTDESVGEPLERLIRLVQADSVADSCIQISFARELAQMKDTTLEGGQGRVWMYQTCAEWGFYQTCDPGTKCVFCNEPHLNNLQSYYDLCKRVFGISGNQTEEMIKFSNEYYGGNSPQGASRIFYINGQVDPWRSQSVQKTINDDLPVLFVPGASHHFWTHPAQKTDSPDIVKARQTIVDQVEKWLNIKNDDSNITGNEKYDLHLVIK